MADDEIERLLREIDATNAAAKPQDAVAKQGSPDNKGSLDKKRNVPATSEDHAGGRLAFSIIAAVGLGAATWFIGLILPFTSAVSAGIGGAIAAFLTAFIAGPPRWFSS
jgi:hypothetical protein